MTVKDILEKEHSKSPGTVILFKEGFFLIC